jgi:2-polyprenyl-3-methyl-5-hydroxy-6-metoxy-1,4-benzoquinol methylase
MSIKGPLHRLRRWIGNSARLRRGSPSAPKRPLPLPYPVAVQARDVAHEARPEGGGVEGFDTPGALAINRARLEHLAALRLPLAGKSVLDVGCGVGHLAQLFVKLGCRVVCVDAREENIASLRQRYPALTEAHVADVQQVPLSRFGRFDVVFCYGLLYHLEDPVAGLRNLFSVCDGLLLLETLVCDYSGPAVVLVDESLSANQARAGLGCRPSPSWVAMALNRVGFPHVYAPLSRPAYQDFQFAWRDNLDHWRDGHPIRCVFVAARAELPHPQLVPLLS